MVACIPYEAKILPVSLIVLPICSLITSRRLRNRPQSPYFRGPPQPFFELHQVLLGKGIDTPEPLKPLNQSSKLTRRCIPGRLSTRCSTALPSPAERIAEVTACYGCRQHASVTLVSFLINRPFHSPVCAWHSLGIFDSGESCRTLWKSASSSMYSPSTLLFFINASMLGFLPR